MHIEPKDWIGIAVGIAGLVASGVAAIKYFADKEKLGGEKERLQERYDELDMRYKEVVELLGTVKMSGSAALLLKSEIDNQLELAAKALQSTAASILVPLPGKNPENFVFLSAIGPVAHQLRRTTVPMSKGVAAHVFRCGEPYLAADTRRDKEFFPGVDLISSYTTTDILCVPIVAEGKTLGVLQFLNKTTGNFTEQDLQISRRFAESLAVRASQFAADPQNFELLGFAPIQAIKDGTILFCDLTASSLLIDTMNFQAALSLINSYLEKACDVVLQHGGTVDKFLGDGAMFRFNVPKDIPDSRMEALRAAVQMREVFEAQSVAWLKAGLPVHSLFTRIGIASGPVREAIMGHPQFQSLTVVGEPVILAANLCNGAPRDRNVILLSAETYAGLEAQLQVKPMPMALLKKIKGQQSTAFELLSCRSQASMR